MSKVKILYKKDAKSDFVPMEVENVYETWRDLVKGLIEIVSYDDFSFIVNEEGLLIGMPYNCSLNRHQLHGPVVVVGSSFEEEDFSSLPDDFELEKIGHNVYQRHDPGAKAEAENLRNLCELFGISEDDIIRIGGPLE